MNEQEKSKYQTEIREHYANLSDDKLIELAGLATLTPEARLILEPEMTSRGLAFKPYHPSTDTPVRKEIESAISLPFAIEQPTLSKFQHFENFSMSIGAALAAIGTLMAASGGIDISLDNGWTINLVNHTIASIGVVLLFGFLAGWAQFFVRLRKYPRLLKNLRWEMVWFFCTFFLGLSLAVIFLPKPIEISIAPPTKFNSNTLGHEPITPFKYYFTLSGLTGIIKADIAARTYNLPALKPMVYDAKLGTATFPPDRKYSCSGAAWSVGPFLLERAWAGHTDMQVSPQYIESNCAPLPPDIAFVLPVHRLASSLLHSWRMHETLPDDATFQANAQLALAEQQGFTFDYDIVFFALNNLRLPAGWAKHPAAKKSIQQAISGKQSLAESFRRLDEQSLREIYGE